MDHGNEHASPVGRENWSIQVSAPFLAEVVKAQLALVREHAEDLRVRLEAIEESQRKRDSSWRQAVFARFRLSDQLLHDAIVVNHEAEKAKGKMQIGLAWLQFLDAMPKDARVSLNQNDFSVFFPGDSFADLKKLWSRES